MDSAPVNSGWLTKWLTSWSPSHSKIHPSQIKDATKEDWTEWEWVMSSTEEFLLKHSEWRMQKTESELDTLRGSSSQFRLRPRFLKSAAQRISSLNPADATDLRHPLDAAKRSKVVTDTIKQCQDAWKSWIKEQFFEGTNCTDKWNRFDCFYSEQPYSKNTVGILKEVAWQASHGQNGTLTARVLADITWSVWNALRGSIRGALDRDLSSEEMSATADVVCRMQAPLLALWLETLRNSRSGSAREGLLPGKWKEEDAQRHARLVARVKTVGVDGRFDSSPVSPRSWERARNQKEVTDMLQSSLIFRINTRF